MNISVEYGGLKLKNPLIAASGGTTGHVDLIKRAEENGAAAVVMKTLFEEEYTRENPTPCFRLINRKAGPLTASTFYSFEQASPYGPERYAEEINRAREAVQIPVIASINCVSEEAWPRYARLLAAAGAAGIEINRSCPFSTVATASRDVWTSLAADTVELVKEAVSVPVFAKMTPQLSDPQSTARMLQSASADGIVMFSRFTGLEIDLETERPVMHGGIAGHGGLWSLHYALRWIAATHPEVDIPVSASGGVGSGDDVIKFLLAGATTVQVCTTLYMEGFKVLNRYLERLREFMSGRGYNSLEQFRGKVCAQIIPTAEVDRNRRLVAIIDGEICNACGRCAEVCLHDAVNTGNTAYLVNERCVGCGLCVQICSRKAVTMIEL